ncbi:flagellar biosynthesis protein FlhA [Microbacterium sp. Root53]|uniref:hypothetical protein n=1 Tax=Microbacterium sp. Root53 TaxID=1736553 RepID=UPI0006F48B0B|nr:hypothetical protein [Microbacterium sp. Root53]KQY96894.1 flagellar biosynthesis protein FlhA [Microbacterium sp. Root53]
MKVSSIWTILGVLVAVVIAWFTVELMFRLMYWMAKLGAVVVVAVIVFFILNWIFSRGGDD